jgi:signal transduction histidine kinase
LLSKRQMIPAESSHFVSAESLRLRLDWFNHMRWAAVVGSLLAVVVAVVWLGVPLPLRQVLVTVAVLAVLNLLYVARNARLAPVDIRPELRLVKLQMAGDLVVLTVLLNLTGGIENPFCYLYVIHVIIASLLFKGREIYQIAGLAVVLFTAMVLSEYAGLLPHNHLLSASELTHELPFILATLGSFWLVLLFAAYMGASIMKHNRAIRDELVRHQAELVAADQAKVDFFRYVTHEVKSPLNTAQSAVETALELGEAAMQPSVADMLHRGVRRLEQATEMVKNLADLTRGGMLKPELLRLVDVVEVLRRTAESQSELAGRRGIFFDLQLPHQPVLMTTNVSMLEKIAANLISNAVRYNKEKGKVTVSLADEGARLVLEVADEGIGIASEDQQKIFEEFYRTDAAQGVTGLGTGLGLSIVKKFVTALGGEVTVQSKPQEGARFRVELPRRVEPVAAVEGK